MEGIKYWLALQRMTIRWWQVVLTQAVTDALGKVRFEMTYATTSSNKLVCIAMVETYLFICHSKTNWRTRGGTTSMRVNI